MKDVVIMITTALGLIGCVLFIIAYHRRSGGNWRRNEIGTWLMLSRINLGLIFALIFANRLFGDWPGRSEVTIFLVVLFALQTFWPSRFIWRASHDNIQLHREETSRDSRT